MHPYMVPNSTMVCNHSPLYNVKNNFKMERYRPIDFNHVPCFPNVLPAKIRDRIPKFSCEMNESVDKHLQRFNDLIDDREDIIIRLFVQFLKDDVGEWFSSFPSGSISTWDEFMSAFNDQFVERK